MKVLIAVITLAILITSVKADVQVILNSPDPSITSWWNNATNDSSTSITVDPGTTVEFGVIADQSVSWYWSGVDSYTDTSTTSNATKTFTSSGTYTVSVYGSNINGTTQTVTWSVQSGITTPTPLPPPPPLSPPPFVMPLIPPPDEGFNFTLLTIFLISVVVVSLLILLTSSPR
jgi:hypothetical protein